MVSRSGNALARAFFETYSARLRITKFSLMGDKEIIYFQVIFPQEGKKSSESLLCKFEKYGKINMMERKKSKNLYRPGCKDYPGLRSGEVFLRNISTVFLENAGAFPGVGKISHKDALQENFNKIGLVTKRLGQAAYNLFGDEVKDERPVFIEEEQWESLINNKIKTK